MEIICENTIRKIDSLGRIGIPKGIRNRMRLEVNQEMDIFTIRDNGKEYIAFARVENSDNLDDKYLKAADLLEELGIAIPDEIIDHINGND